MPDAKDYMKSLERLLENPPERRPDEVTFWSIGGIPAVNTADHNEYVFFWEQLGMEGLSCFRVDGHGDFMDYIRPRDGVAPYYVMLDINEQYAAGVHYGHLRPPIFWLNPFSEERRLQMLDKKTRLDQIGPSERIVWDASPSELRSIRDSKCTVIGPEDVQIQHPFLLDIDLDGLSSVLVHNVPCGYDGTRGYDARIQYTMDVVRGLDRPDAIFITRSHPAKGDEKYVPSEFVADVETKTLDGLGRLYGAVMKLGQWD
ncbi:MAG: hypothetical protein ABH879_10595 [archaeon]